MSNRNAVEEKLRSYFLCLIELCLSTGYMTKLAGSEDIGVCKGSGANEIERRRFGFSCLKDGFQCGFKTCKGRKEL